MDRRGGRAVDLKVRVARQGRELCGRLAPVAQQTLLGPGQRHFPSALGYLSIALGGAVALPRGLRGEAGHAPRALVLRAAAGVGGRGSQGQPLPAGQRLEVVDQAVVAAAQEKQHGVPDDARAARGAQLADMPAPPAQRGGRLLEGAAQDPGQEEGHLRTRTTAASCGASSPTASGSKGLCGGSGQRPQAARAPSSTPSWPAAEDAAPQAGSPLWPTRGLLRPADGPPRLRAPQRRAGGGLRLRVAADPVDGRAGVLPRPPAARARSADTLP